VEAIVLSIVSGLVFGVILGYFTTYRIFSDRRTANYKVEESPNIWLERHKNLNSSLIQLRRKTEVKEGVALARQKNLQLQMNPHFIFNALTGIHMLLLRKDRTNALRGIRKFKGLLLRSWGNSIDNPKKLRASSLGEETAFLNDYVELEQMRLSTRVDFVVSHSSNINSDYPIPSFLIQPLVENALWHGVNSEEESRIEVHFEADDRNNVLKISVIDDGQGLVIEEDATGKRKSFGLKILRERLLLISEDSQFIVENRKDKRGCAAYITIPLFHGIT
jgi:sensor histidine kinase YesM